MLIVILSLPRSGSSAVSKKLNDIGIEHFIWKNLINQSRSEFNKQGYFEDVGLNLINDNLIRYHYGNESSFLNTSNIKLRKEITKNTDFYFDLNEDTVEIPFDYEEKIKIYTGHDWDVWGLTRMTKGKKWYKCYSKYDTHTYKSLHKSQEKYLKSLIRESKRKNIFIKDPRLIFTLQHWQIPDEITKYIVIERNREDLLKSLRNHYGKNLFTDLSYEDYDWVSNHFNYKIKYQTYDDYINKFESLIKPMREKENFTFVKFENVVSEKFSSEISKKLRLKNLK